MIGLLKGIAASQGIAFDPDAQTYFTSAGITDGTEKSAANQAFLNTKGQGSTTNNTNFYSKLFFLGLVSPTSLAAASVNACNPGTYDVTWPVAPTHTTEGVQGNGSTQYGDTGLNANTVLSQDNCGFTFAINSLETVNGTCLGVRTSTTNTFEATVFSNSMRLRVAVSLANQIIAGAGPFDDVHTAVRRASNDVEYYLNGVSSATSSAVSSALPNGNIYLLGENLVGSGLNAPDPRRFTFFAIHEALTDNEAQDLYDTITTYNANVISGGR